MFDKELSKLIGYPVDVSRFSKSQDKKMRLSLEEDGKGKIWFKVPMTFSSDAIAKVLLSIRNILSPIFEIILPSQEEHSTKWLDIDSFKELMESDMPSSKKIDTREIKTAVLHQKGYYVADSRFLCPICSKYHNKGYSYDVDGKDVIVCKYCHDDILDKKIWTKLILINAGGSR